jgi:MYXO-CTERM domain-containing protein
VPDHGCGCHLVGAGQDEAAWLGALGILGLLAGRRRRAARP